MAFKEFVFPRFSPPMYQRRRRKQEECLSISQKSPPKLKRTNQPLCEPIVVLGTLFGVWIDDSCVVIPSNYKNSAYFFSLHFFVCKLVLCGIGNVQTKVFHVNIYYCIFVFTRYFTQYFNI